MGVKVLAVRVGAEGEGGAGTGGRETEESDGLVVVGTGRKGEEVVPQLFSEVRRRGGGLFCADEDGGDSALVSA